jgi:hypothetical protein
MALTDNLQAFYKLSDFSDSSGNNRTLTNNGNVSFASGKIGNAAVFDGSNWMEQSFDPSALSDFTMCAWVKSNGDNSGVTYPQFVVTSSNSFGLAYDFGQQAFYTRIANEGNQSIAYSETCVLDNGEWNLVVGKRINGSMYVSVNGSSFSAESYSDATGIDSGNLLLGSLQGSYGFNGQIDAVGIWNRALSDAEVAELYNNGNGLELDPPNYRGEWDNFTYYGQDDVVSVSGVYWKLTGLGGWTVGGAPGLGYGWTLLGFIPSAVRISGNAKFQGNVKFA